MFPALNYSVNAPAKPTGCKQNTAVFPYHLLYLKVIPSSNYIG